MKKLIFNSHLAVSLGFTLASYALGFNPVYASLIVSAYWAGREVAQAENRYLNKYRMTREEMPVLTGYYNPKAWNVESFFGDMVIPFVASITLSVILQNI